MARTQKSVKLNENKKKIFDIGVRILILEEWGFGKRNITLSGAVIGDVSDDRKGFHRDYQPAVDIESAKRNGTFYVGYSWRI